MLNRFIWTDVIHHHLSDWSWLWFACGIFYVPVIFGLQSLRTSTPSYIKDNVVFIRIVRANWAVWNLFLAIFSAIGCYHTYFGVIDVFKNGHCIWADGNLTWLNGDPGKWLYYFVVSKLVELGDTAFLAILGKPIPFLHWYHHILTTFMCFWIFVDVRPYQILGPFINYFIHAIMYSYYASSAIGSQWGRSVAKAITTAQTTQMLLMTAYYSRLLWLGGECSNFLLPGTVMMYVLYLGLFMKYFVGRYTKKLN